MPAQCDSIRQAIAELMPSAKEFLCRLIEFPSTSGKEHELFCWAEEPFQRLGVEVRRVPLSKAIKHDEDYSSPVADIRYDGRFNLRLRLPGTGGGRRLLFNSHADVVPPSQGQEKPWQAVEKDGIISGRGACDAKGQVATIYLVLAALKKLNRPLRGDLIAHIVNEEENGGNGSLAMARAGETADACIVMEPSSGKIFSSVRGAVWFRILCQGKAGHSGRAGDTISASRWPAWQWTCSRSTTTICWPRRGGFRFSISMRTRCRSRSAVVERAIGRPPPRPERPSRASWDCFPTRLAIR